MTKEIAPRMRGLLGAAVAGVLTGLLAAAAALGVAQLVAGLTGAAGEPVIAAGPAAPGSSPGCARKTAGSAAVRVAVLRRSSRDTVNGDRPIRAAITRMLSSRHRPSAISSRSASDSLPPATAPSGSLPGTPGP